MGDCGRLEAPVKFCRQELCDRYAVNVSGSGLLSLWTSTVRCETCAFAASLLACDLIVVDAFSYYFCAVTVYSSPRVLRTAFCYFCYFRFIYLFWSILFSALPCMACVRWSWDGTTRTLDSDAGCPGWTSTRSKVSSSSTRVPCRSWWTLSSLSRGRCVALCPSYLPWEQFFWLWRSSTMILGGALRPRLEIFLL